MTSPLDRVDLESDVTRGALTGLAFLVALAFNLDPQRRGLALAVFGGGAVAFFGLAFLARRNEKYDDSKLRWSLFAAWGVVLFAVGLGTESTVGVVLGLVVGVYAALRAWLSGALTDGPTADASAPDEQGREGPSTDESSQGGPPPDGEAITRDALPPHLWPEDEDDLQ